MPEATTRPAVDTADSRPLIDCESLRKVGNLLRSATTLAAGHHCRCADASSRDPLRVRVGRSPTAQAGASTIQSVRWWSSPLEL